MVKAGSSRSRTRRNAAVLVSTAAVAAVLFRYPTSTHSGRAQGHPGRPAAAGIVATGTSTAGPPPAATPSAPRPSAPRPSVTTPSVTTPSGPSAAAAAPTLTVNGTAVGTPYGPVQVQITVRGGRIRTATALAYPDGSGRDHAINSVAIPRLTAETVTAQSARIDAVSGATYTSAGYLRSLQSALDAAHL